MGTLTLRADEISVWRDYFDPADFERQLAALKGIGASSNGSP